MDLPDEIYFDCPECGETTPHDVLKGRMAKSLEATLRCQECKHVFATTIKLPKIITLKVVVSDGPTSTSTAVELESEDIVALGDEFLLDDGRRVKVTGVELSDGAKVKKARASNISSVWVILFDEINIKISINDVQKTHSRYLRAEPEDEFRIGDILSFDGMDCLVHSIKIKDRMIRRGSAEAKDIVRIYGKLRKGSRPILDFEDDLQNI